jgi:uracil-DNA glycosylase
MSGQTELRNDLAADEVSDEATELLAISRQLRAHLGRLHARGVRTLPVPAPAPPVVACEASRPAGLSLVEIRAELGDCTRCKLHTTRKNIVFGVGSPDADLVFVGEGPGANEDLQGEPFVGEAGQLLTKMIEAMGWSRDTVYICNIVKCRPPGNRNPQPDEISQCEPFLVKQLAALRPRVIVALGKFAAQVLLRKPDAPISTLRGKFHEYQGIPVMPTFHPAYLLRTPSAKRTVWEDLQRVMGELDRLGIQAPRAVGSATG